MVGVAAGLATSCSCRRYMSRTSPGCRWDRPRRSFRPSCLSARTSEIQHGRRYRSCMREEFASVLLSPIQAYPEWCHPPLVVAAVRVVPQSGFRSGQRAIGVHRVHHVSDIWMLYDPRHGGHLTVRRASGRRSSGNAISPSVLGPDLLSCR